MKENLSQADRFRKIIIQSKLSYSTKPKQSAKTAQSKTGQSSSASPKQKTYPPKYPEAYKVKRQNFYGRDFSILPRQVLIPRPETEQLIDSVLDLAGKPYLQGVAPNPRQLPDHPVIVDVGTGSGCIAITLKLELPDSTVYGVDISENALKVAKRNVKIHQTDVTFFISNLLKNATFHRERAIEIMCRIPRLTIPDRSHIDLVVANLPYVDRTWEWLDKEALSFEPEEALYAGEHGLKFNKRLMKEAAELKVKYLVLEADPCQHSKLIDFAKSQRYEHLKTRGFALTFVLS